MGDPKKLRRKYRKPRHPWQAFRIKEEKNLIRKYGVKNKKELWRALSRIRQWRRQAREITEMRGEKAEEAKEVLINKLRRLGILGGEAKLEDVLSLKITDILERRLQTQVFNKGLSSTVKQARQFISHGKVMVNDQIITSPSYTVRKSDDIGLTPEFEKRLSEIKKKEKKDGQKEK